MRFGVNRFNNRIANNKIYFWEKRQEKEFLKEIERLPEIVCDYLCGDNEYHSTEERLVRYFDRFVILEGWQI